MAENKAFFLTAVGHYGADDVKIELHLESQSPSKRMLELDYLEGAVRKHFAQLREQFQDERDHPEKYQHVIIPGEAVA